MRGSAFLSHLQAQIKLKNVPNVEVEEGTFSFADYFDGEAFRESFTGEVVAITDHVERAFTPYRTYFAGAEEITLDVYVEGEMWWADVTVTIPDDVDRQHLLADLVADAWHRRLER